MAKAKDLFLAGTNQKAVLLCHTLGGDPTDMKGLAKTLNKAGYTVSCPLYPGHGSTFDDMVATEITEWYDTVSKEFDRLKETYPSVYVVGMSIGGTFTVKLAQEKEVAGIATVNAPVIGFDLYTDLFQYSKAENDKEKITRYRDHRYIYFKFVVELGQTENLKKITCPLFVLQGSMDQSRYKTSSMMLMDYVSSKVTQRKDYRQSRHLLLLEPDRKEAFKDILDFFENN
jgi:carboxylesterase